MQEMARSLMPSEVPATIFIPVDNGYGGVRIYELHDSDAAGAAIWVETLRAVVHLRGHPWIGRPMARVPGPPPPPRSASRGRAAHRTSPSKERSPHPAPKSPPSAPSGRRAGGQKALVRRVAHGPLHVTQARVRVAGAASGSLGALRDRPGTGALTTAPYSPQVRSSRRPPPHRCAASVSDSRRSGRASARRPLGYLFSPRSRRARCPEDATLRRVSSSCSTARSPRHSSLSLLMGRMSASPLACLGTGRIVRLSLEGREAGVPGCEAGVPGCGCCRRCSRCRCCRCRCRCRCCRRCCCRCRCRCCRCRCCCRCCCCCCCRCRCRPVDERTHPGSSHAEQSQKMQPRSISTRASIPPTIKSRRCMPACTSRLATLARSSTA